MKESFNVKGKSGSVAIFVLVGLLFMSSFLIVSYAYNVNKSKVAKEQFDIISDIYSHKDGDANAYERAYTALRKKNKQTLTKTVENSSTLELERTYEENLVNYRIYGKGSALEGYKITITDFTKEGFLPVTGTYPDTTDTRFPNAKYEIINIKKGQTFKFDYMGINEAAGEYTTIGYIRVRCIDADTNEVVCDLVHNNDESVTETDYYITNLYYTYSKQQTDDIDGYVTAKKDFKIGIMYLLEKPDDFKLKIESTSQVKLPEEYKQVEYIESTGRQYIDTGYIPNSNTSIEIKASSSSTSNATLYCARTAITNKTYTAFLIGGDKLRVDYNSNNTSYQNLITANRDTPYIYKQDKNKVYVNGELLKSMEEDAFSAEYSMYLLASHSAGTGINNVGKIKLYYCRIWDNGKIVRDFVPCYKNENGVDIAGLYDTVEGVFYRSIGSADFVKGKDIPSVGDFITDITDENYGKYKIDIKITKENEEDTVVKQIVLDKLLFEGEYIDFKSQKVVRNDGTEESINLPKILMNEDYTKIEVLTEVTPSKVEVEYVGYTIE